MPPTDEQERGGSWVSREVEAMITAWERGAEVTAQDVLNRRAEVDAESAIRLIYEETCLRREAGQPPRQRTEDAADAPLVHARPCRDLAHPVAVHPQPDDLVMSRRAGAKDIFPDLAALCFLAGPGLGRVTQ